MLFEKVDKRERESERRDGGGGGGGVESGVKPSTDLLLLLFNTTLESHLKFKAPFLVSENTFTRAAINTAQREKASVPPDDLHDSTGMSNYNGRHTCAYIL